MEESITKHRINWIDWAKVFTITLVVLGHQPFAPHDAYFQYFIYSFHVPLFYLLSGYLSKPDGKTKALIIKDIQTILAPYLYINLLCFFLFYLPINGLQTEQIGAMWIAFARGISGSPAPATWFLVSLFFCKLLSYLILRQRWAVQAIILISFPLIAILLNKAFGYEFLFKLPTTLLGTIFFVVGHYAKKYDVMQRFVNNSYLPVLLIITFLFQLFLVHTQLWVETYSITLGTYAPLYFVEAINGSLMMIFLSMMLHRFSSDVLRTLSVGTIIILGAHTYIPQLLYGLADQFFGFHGVSLLSNIVVSLASVLLLYYPIKLVLSYCPALIGNRK